MRPKGESRRRRCPYRRCRRSQTGSPSCQGIEALDRALRYARRVTNAVSGASLPSGIDWERIAKFARRGRDALAHGDERLTAPGLGYSLRMSDGIVRQFGKARTERKWRTDELPMADLVAAIQALVDWLDKESSM